MNGTFPWIIDKVHHTCSSLTLAFSESRTISFMWLDVSLADVYVHVYVYVQTTRALSIVADMKSHTM